MRSFYGRNERQSRRKAQVVDIPIKSEDRRCHRCDEFTFVRRDGAGLWAYCRRRDIHFPDGIVPGEHRCENLKIYGVLYGKGKDNEV